MGVTTITLHGIQHIIWWIGFSEINVVLLMLQQVLFSHMVSWEKNTNLNMMTDERETIDLK